MCLSNKKSVCILLFVLLAVSWFFMSAQVPSAKIVFIEYDHGPSIMDDPDIQTILRSSLFEGVSEETSHSAERHAGDQDLKDECLGDNGTPVIGMINPETKHCVEIIQTNVEEGGHVIERFLVRVVKQIDGAYHEITAFTDEWANIQQVENYLNGVGYMQIWP